MRQLNLILIKYLGDCVIFNLSFRQTQSPNLLFLRGVKYVTLVAAATLIQACATKPQQNLDVTSVEQLTDWNARGKLLLKNNKDKLSGYFFWQQKNNGDFKLAITSFIGTNLMSLTYADQHTELTLDGKQYRGENPEQLIYQLTGSYIPVRNMAKWMLAQAPSSAEKSISEQQLKGFSYKDDNANQWQIEYQTYQKVALLTLPEKVIIEGLDNRIKLTINEWELLTL